MLEPNQLTKTKTLFICCIKKTYYKTYRMVAFELQTRDTVVLFINKSIAGYLLTGL